MKLKAINRIEKGSGVKRETILPGQSFECSDEKECRRLVSLGAAEEDTSEAPDPSDDDQVSREELITMIKECISPEEVDFLIKDEKRVTVLDAAKKRKAELATKE